LEISPQRPPIVRSIVHHRYALAQQLQIFVYRFLAIYHRRGGFITRPSEIGTISALSDKNGMNMGGIAV
jgi:hypothetical protein